MDCVGLFCSTVTVAPVAPLSVKLKDLPKKLLSTLAQPGAGQKYVQVDDNVLLISEGTKMILDAIGAVK